MQQPASYPEVYTVEEFAKIFKLSPEAVRNLIRQGEILAIRIGKQYRIPQNVVDRYFAQALSPEAFLQDMAESEITTLDPAAL
jgi:excisionase family DNA binding protein